MSTEDEYTPTTEEVRADHARSLTYPKFVSPIRARQFDRWLAGLLEGERARARTEITVTDEMVERVAAAMLEETYGSGAWASREPMEDVLYRRRARVAIVATLETNHTIRGQEEES